MTCRLKRVIKNILYIKSKYNFTLVTSRLKRVIKDLIKKFNYKLNILFCIKKTQSFSFNFQKELKKKKTKNLREFLRIYKMVFEFLS